MKNGKIKSEISLDEPLNVDWEGNKLLLSDVLERTRVDLQIWSRRRKKRAKDLHSALTTGQKHSGHAPLDCTAIRSERKRKSRI